MLDPFQPENSDHVAHLKSLQGEIFFISGQVKSRRGAKLKVLSRGTIQWSFLDRHKAKS